MDIDTITLVTVIINMIVQPVFTYMINSRCTKVNLCCGCIELERSVKEEDIKPE